jgi:hypothetical protein
VKTEEELNPYAPPSAGVAVPTAKPVDPNKRPAAVKWTMALTLLLFLSTAVAYGTKIAETGWAPWVQAHLQNPLKTTDSMIRILSLIIVFGGKRKAAYWIGVGMLIWTSWRFPVSLYRAGALAAPGATLLALVTALLWLLLWRFTFGKPTRRYYRMIP